jgi:hypothetical protein
LSFLRRVASGLSSPPTLLLNIRAHLEGELETA